MIVGGTESFCAKLAGVNIRRLNAILGARYIGTFS
jgi:hypothetical protein